MRIASLAPSVTTMLQELGADSAVVACTHLCPLPRAQRTKLAVGSFSVLNEAAITAAKPDIVVTATLVQAKGQQRLRDAGFTVLHLDPRSLADIAATYLQLGEAIGKQAAGAELQRDFLEQLAALQDQVSVPHAARYPVPRVYMEEWHEPPFVAGNWIPDMVALAGGEAVLSTPGTPSRQISLAELTAADPDIIVQHVCLPPTPHAPRQREHFRQQLQARPGWGALRAVRHNRVHAMEDSPFNMPTRQVLEGVRILQNVLAPTAARA